MYQPRKLFPNGIYFLNSPCIINLNIYICCMSDSEINQEAMLSRSHFMVESMSSLSLDEKICCIANMVSILSLMYGVRYPYCSDLGNKVGDFIEESIVSNSVGVKFRDIGICTKN